MSLNAITILIYVLNNDNTKSCNKIVMLRFQDWPCVCGINLSAPLILYNVDIPDQYERHMYCITLIFQTSTSVTCTV